MSNQKKVKVSIPFVLILLSLMISFIFVQLKVFGLWENSDGSSDFKVIKSEYWGEIEDIKAAKEMYLSLKNETAPPNFIDKSVRPRGLKYFHSLRAYSGAPPIIPHPVTESKSLIGDSCLACHKNGGFTPKFNAYAPVVPHPEKVSCRQCHNPAANKSLFKKTLWQKAPSKRGFAHLPGSPLIIPHSLQMRENCLSCHSGPAAVAEIRTTHPERVSCMQCHVEELEVKVWERK